MDINNATAAGPSQGILDVLFGSKPKEEQAEGEQFGPLLSLMKALNKEKNGDETVDKGRTEKETEAGRVGLDYPYSVMPGMMPTTNPMSTNNISATSVDADGMQQIGSTSFGKTNQAVPIRFEKPELALMTEEVASESEAATSKAALADPSALKHLEKMSPEAKALVSGMLLGGVLEDARLAQNNMAFKATGLMNAKDELVNQGELKAQGSEIPATSTQDFLQMRLAARMAALEGQQMVPAQNNPLKLESGKDIAALASAKLAGKKLTKDGELNGLDSGIAKLGEKEMSSSLDNISSRAIEAMKAPDTGLKTAHDHMAGVGAKLGEGVGAAVVTKEVFLDGNSKEHLRAGIIPVLTQTITTPSMKAGGEMRLILHPDDMGEVRVKVGTKGGRVEVSVTAENKEVADVIRRSSKDLEEALGDHHLQLTKFEVHVTDNGKGALAEMRGAGMNSDTSSSGRDTSSFFGNAQSDANAQSQNQSGNFSSGREFSSERRESPAPTPIRPQATMASSSFVQNKGNNNKMGRLDVVA